MRTKSGLHQEANGLWVNSEGGTLANVAEILPDKVFNCEFLRGKIKPHDLVYYFSESVFRVENKMPEEMFFITVIPYGKGGEIEPEVVPLYQLGLAPIQVDEIKKWKHLPERAFKKNPIARTSEELSAN